MKKHFLFPVAICVLLCGCHGDALPKGVMDHEQMVGLLTEAYVLESLYAVENEFDYTALDTAAMEGYEELLSRRGLTRELVDSSMAYYTKHLDEYASIHDEVVARLDSMRAEL